MVRAEFDDRGTLKVLYIEADSGSLAAAEADEFFTECHRLMALRQEKSADV